VFETVVFVLSCWVGKRSRRFISFEQSFGWGCAAQFDRLGVSLKEVEEDEEAQEAFSCFFEAEELVKEFPQSGLL
jgi:hypothetical protein